MKLNYLPIWATGLLLSFSLLTSCKDDLKEITPAQPAPTAISDSSGTFKKGTFRRMPITYQVIDGKAIWQGDILLTPEDLAGGSNPNARTEGLGREEVYFRWHNWTISYEISDQLPANQVALAKQAMADWEAKTPIRFKPRSTTLHPDYIRFVTNNSSTNSWAPIGRHGSMQEVSLSKNATLDIIRHEIGHSIGLFHEHTRSDRDNYVTVYKENIIPGLEGNFDILNPAEGFDFGSFDYNSIMLYGPFTGAKKHPDGSIKATLSRKDNLAMKNNTEISSGDARTVKAMYSNLYIVHNETLYGANSYNGAYVSYPAVWAGTAKTIAVGGPYMYTMQYGKLWKTDRLTGKYKSIGNGNWHGAVGITGMDPSGYMYAQAGTRLWKIDANGSFTRLGGPQALENWTGTQAVYYHNKTLYVIWKNTLYKINTTTGLVDKQYGGLWQDVKGMAAPDPTGKFLYIIINTSLWKVDVVSGALSEVAYNTFPAVEGMTYASGAPETMLVVSNDGLYSVSANGTKRYLSGGWAGTIAMGGF